MDEQPGKSHVMVCPWTTSPKRALPLESLGRLRGAQSNHSGRGPVLWLNHSGAGKCHPAQLCGGRAGATSCRQAQLEALRSAGWFYFAFLPWQAAASGMRWMGFAWKGKHSLKRPLPPAAMG